MDLTRQLRAEQAIKKIQEFDRQACHEKMRRTPSTSLRGSIEEYERISICLYRLCGPLGYCNKVKT